MPAPCPAQGSGHPQKAHPLQAHWSLHLGIMAFIITFQLLLCYLFTVIYRNGLLDNEIYYFIQLIIADEGTLHTHRLVVAHGVKEHIALAQQLFGSAHINNGARICLRGYGESNT